jgi:DNA-binding transcriptional ArsR family regulator
MSTSASFAEIAALAGDPARANMLLSLMDGRALTASELAFAAHVTPQTASGHLGKLVAARLLSVSNQGRHRYFRLASPLVARMLESIDVVAAIEAPPRIRRIAPREAALRRARFCYDHLAGRLGVALADALTARRHVVFDEDGGVVTRKGATLLAGFGIDLAAAERTRRAFCRPCLDWSERRPHIAGALGAALAARCFALGWLARLSDSRAVTITRPGREGLKATFAIQGFDDDAPTLSGSPSAS